MMSAVKTSIDPELKPLVVQALSAYEQGKPRAGVHIISFDALLNDYLFQEMSKRVPPSEIAILTKAAKVRGYGFALAKKDDLVNGQQAIELARSLYVHESFSPEAFAVAETFHEAAIAYVHHKMNDYSSAYQALLSSLKYCKVLRDDYGYEIEARRIHLARNLIRVESTAGNSEIAIRLIGSLLNYLNGDVNVWPFPETRLSTNPDQLETPLKLFLADQVLGEAYSLLSQPKPIALNLIKMGEPYLFSEDFNDDSDLAKVHLWLSAMRASVEDDIPTFLKKVALFLADGPGYMGRTWQAAVKELFKMCQKIFPEMSDFARNS